MNRFSLLWYPCIEALAAALEHCSQHSWPLLLAQLTAAQASFLAGSSAFATAGRGGGRGPSEQSDSAEVPQLFGELRRAMCSGDADQNGGCTDAAVRLANILKVEKSDSWHTLFDTTAQRNGQYGYRACITYCACVSDVTAAVDVPPAHVKPLQASCLLCCVNQ